MSTTIKFKNSSLKLRKFGGFSVLHFDIVCIFSALGRRMNSETKTLQELLRKCLLVVLDTKNLKHQFFTFHWLISPLLRAAVIEILVTNCVAASLKWICNLSLDPSGQKNLPPHNPKTPKALGINWPSLLVVSGRRLWAPKMNKLLTFFWSSPWGLRQWLGYALPFPI